MEKHTAEELAEAMQTVIGAFDRCQRALLRFDEGSPQHTLLKNRVKALNVAKALMTGMEAEYKPSEEEMVGAIRPIASIISKCEKAQHRFTEGTMQHMRLCKLIKAMCISKSLISDAIDGMGR